MSDQPQQQTIYTSPTPDLTQFDDASSVKEFAEHFGYEHGFAITTRRSRRRGGPNTEIISFDFKCDRSASKLRGGWVLKYKNNNHNQQLDDDSSGHPSARRLNETSSQTVAVMSASRSSPREIVSSLRQSNPIMPLIARTVYNERHGIRQNQLDGRTPIRALLDELTQTDKYLVDFKVGDGDDLTHLFFFAHRKSLDWIRRYGSVLLMDCTYKVNRFKMPLLQVVGITCFWTTFFCCFVFLAAETQEDYEWAMGTINTTLYNGLSPPITIVTDRDLGLMNAISSVFPSTNLRLCIWHIQKKSGSQVQACISRYRRRLGRIYWNVELDGTILGSRRIRTSMESSIRTYRAGNFRAVAYIESTWMQHKQLFGTPWTRRLLHLRSTTTSRVESAHSMLKSYIKVSTRHLRDVQEMIALAVDNQDSEIKAKIQNDRIRIAHTHQIPIFSNLIGRISGYALAGTLKQMNKSTEANLPPCTNSFTTTMGLPCAHFILNITQNSINGKLTMEDFHRQWWIDDSVDIPENEVQEGQNGHGDIQIVMDRLLNRYNQWPLPQQLQARQRLTEMAFGPSPLIHDPVIRRGRGRPVGSTARHTTSSTQRDPSSFEIVERTERHCGRCRQPGHTVRTCPN